MNISSDESLDNSPVDIPLGELTDEVLRGVIESYVLREGTEYGARDFTLQEKVDHVLAQLRRRDARIVYNPQDQTVDIVTKGGGRR
jgi:uncharacterized protein YheU (UPF0270 family)